MVIVPTKNNNSNLVTMDRNLNTNKPKADHKTQITSETSDQSLIPINSIIKRIWGQKISLKFLIYKSQWD